MKDLNKITLIGRLGTEPIQRKTKNGISVVNFSLATSSRVRSGDGFEESFKDETQWHRIVIWGKLADICSQYLRKGEKVFVEGVGKTRKFIGKDDQYRYLFEVHAESVHFMGGSRMSRVSPEHETQMAPESGNGLDTQFDHDMSAVVGTA